MKQQLKRDLIAAIALGAMFLGAFILPTTWFGFVLIGGGGLAVSALFLMIVFDKR